MTFDDMVRKVLDIFPDAIVSEDEDGQVVINTGLTIDGDRIVEIEND